MKFEKKIEKAYFRRSFRYKQTFLNWLNLKSNSFVWINLMLGRSFRSKDVIKNDDSHAPLRVQACPFATAGHDPEGAFKSAA